MTVQDVLGTYPYDIHTIPAKTGALATTLIAVDIYGKFGVSCDVFLHKSYSLHHEFKFGITVTPTGNLGDPRTIYSSKEARNYVPDDRRGDIGDIVCESVGMLIEMVRPDSIFRQLAEPHKPSLRLHNRISATILHHGYILKHQDLSTGELLHVRKP